MLKLRAWLVLIPLALSAFGAGGTDISLWRRPMTIPFPADAKYDPRIAGLGKMLFFDPRLSGAQNMSCASCHNPSFGWETPVAHAVGAANLPLGRSAPTTLNLAWTGPLYFWDGRAHSLEDQAGGPITAAAEMNATFQQVIARLSEVEDYRHWFEVLYPGEGITETTIRRSIATYERTIVSGWAPFDRWIEGDPTAISTSAQRGFDLFAGTAGCSRCHAGWNFSDSVFSDIGLNGNDIGRAGITNDAADSHKFKSPSLRNISLRAPYMHDGSLPTLDAVVRHYMSGGIDRPTRSAKIQPFQATDEQVNDIVAFLNTLTEEETLLFTPVLPAN